MVKIYKKEQVLACVGVVYMLEARGLLALVEEKLGSYLDESRFNIDELEDGSVKVTELQ